MWRAIDENNEEGTKPNLEGVAESHGSTSVLDLPTSRIKVARDTRKNNVRLEDQRRDVQSIVIMFFACFMLSNIRIFMTKF